MELTFREYLLDIKIQTSVAKITELHKRVGSALISAFTTTLDEIIIYHIPWGAEMSRIHNQQDSGGSTQPQINRTGSPNRCFCHSAAFQSVY